MKIRNEEADQVNSTRHVSAPLMLKPRELIAGLAPYRSPIVSRAGLSLDLNESMAGCSPRVLARLHSLSAKDVSLYPEREVGERLVANFLGVTPEQVLLTNGMDEALSLLFTTYLNPDDELLFADPTFVMYPMLGEALGARLVRQQSGEDLALPINEREMAAAGSAVKTGAKGTFTPSLADGPRRQRAHGRLFLPAQLRPNTRRPSGPAQT